MSSLKKTKKKTYEEKSKNTKKWKHTVKFLNVGLKKKHVSVCVWVDFDKK